MKKICSYILLILLLFTSSLNVFAEDDSYDSDNLIDVQPVFTGGSREPQNIYSDVEFLQPEFVRNSGDKNLKKMYQILSGLNIIRSGDVIMSDIPVTRAQFTAWIVRFANLNVTDNVNRYFKDVTADNKYCTEINTAAMMGYISGEDGTFEPDEPITYAEAVSIAVKALGYSIYAEVNGGYPSGYLKAARISGLNTVEKNNLDGELYFGSAAELIYNALDAYVFDWSSYSDSKVNFAKNDKALYAFFELNFIYGRVDANFVTSLPGRTKTGNGEMAIDGIVYKAPDSGMCVDLLGYYVEALADDDNNIKIAVKDYDRISETIINGSEINNFEDFTYTYGDNDKRVKINPNHILIVNGIRVSEYSLKDFVPEMGNVVLLSDNGSKPDTVIVNNGYPFIMKECVGENEADVLFKSVYSDVQFGLKLSDGELNAKFYLNGDEINFSVKKSILYDADADEYKQYCLPDIPENSVLNIFADKYKFVNGSAVPADDASIVRIYITTQYVEGYVGSYSGGNITVDDEELYVANRNVLNLSDVKIKSRIQGKFLLDCEGNVTACIPANSSEMYAYLIDAIYDDEKRGGSLRLKLIDEKGNKNIYDINDKIKINGQRGDDTEDLYNKLRQSASYTRDDGEIGQVISFAKNDDGRIVSINVADKSIGINKSENCITRNCKKTTLKSRTENGNSYYTPNGVVLYNPGERVIFNVPSVYSSDENEYYVMEDWGYNQTERTTEMYDCDKNLIPAVVVVYSDEKNALDLPYFMVDRAVREVDEDGNINTYIYGLDGKHTTLVKYKANKDNMFDGLKRGDFLIVYGRDDTVYDYTVVKSIDEIKTFDVSSSYRMTSYECNDVFELYSVFDNSYIVLQRGMITEKGAREYQQCNYLVVEGTNLFLYDATVGKNAKIESFYNPEYLDNALNDGNDKASKVYIYTKGTDTIYVIVYKGI